jgi:hypothetical protein
MEVSDMAKFEKYGWLASILILALSLALGISVNVVADSGAYGEGSFSVFAFNNGNWQWQGKTDFNNYETRQLQMQHDAGLFKLRLVQQGHDAAFVDYVALYKDGATYHPISAINIGNNIDVLAKILSPEYDVCDAWSTTLEIVWENVPANATLILRAMEEDLGSNHVSPLFYPYVYSGQTLKYTLVNDGGIIVDGLLAESKEPDFSVFWMPISPHPAGYTYGWIHSDSEYFYNTPDTGDWGAIFLLINGEIKEFRVSTHDSRWGVIGFQYTSSIPYEHRVYEFKIPLNEIGAHTGDEIQYGFGCYGTVAAGIISGNKFNDLNGNGVKDEDESGLPGWTIHLVGHDNSGRTVKLMTTTLSDGAYRFFGIQSGNYTISEVQKPGWEQTCPDIPGDGDWDIVVSSGPKDYDFGNRFLLGVGRIRNITFYCDDLGVERKKG